MNVTVKVIPEEAVDKSGSIRLNGITAEEFIEPNRVSIVSIRYLSRKRTLAMWICSIDDFDLFLLVDIFLNGSLEIPRASNIYECVFKGFKGDKWPNRVVLKSCQKTLTPSKR